MYVPLNNFTCCYITPLYSYDMIVLKYTNISINLLYYHDTNSYFICLFEFTSQYDHPIAML